MIASRVVFHALCQRNLSAWVGSPLERHPLGFLGHVTPAGCARPQYRQDTVIQDHGLSCSVRPPPHGLGLFLGLNSQIAQIGIFLTREEQRGLRGCPQKLFPVGGGWRLRRRARAPIGTRPRS